MSYAKKYSEMVKVDDLLREMDGSNVLTIILGPEADFYLEVIRIHFRRTLDKDPSRKTITLQAYGDAVQNLVFVACLVDLKGFGKVKKISNDSVPTRGVDHQNGYESTCFTVRLLVNIEVSENFRKICDHDESKSRKD